MEVSTVRIPRKTRAVKNQCSRRDPNRAAVEDRREVERHESAERWRAIQAGTQTTETTHPAIARMNEIQHLGEPDRIGFKPCGPFRLYQGAVGEGKSREIMQAQVTEWGGDVVICFWAVGDGRYRRLLVTTDPRTDCPVAWVALGIFAIRHTGKYARAGYAILKLRAKEKEAADV